MVLKIYVKWDKEPFEYDCIAINTEKERDEHNSLDESFDICFLDFHYLEKDDSGKIHIRRHDFKAEDIVKICGKRNTSLLPILDEAVAETLNDICEGLEYVCGVSIDFQIEK